MMNIKTNLLKNLTATFVIIFAVAFGDVGAQEEPQVNPNNYPLCKGKDLNKWTKCFAIETSKNGGVVSAVRDKNGKLDGWVSIHSVGGRKTYVKFENGKDTENIYSLYPSGETYIGQSKEGKKHGKGVLIYENGNKKQGIFKNDVFISEEKSLSLKNENNSRNKNDYFESFPSSLLEIKNLNIQVATKNTQGIIPPSQKIANLKIHYPPLSKRMGETGIVVLKILIKENGKVGIVELLKSSGFVNLDDAAINGVKLWDFHPAMSDGNSISSWEELSIPFILK